MSLAIANCTRGPLEFHYREPVNKLLQVLRIHSGCQEVVGRTWTPDQKQFVIDQLERFGARDAAEVYRDMGAFHGITYRDQGVISSDEIRLGNEAVVETQQERSVREATRSALGFDRAVRRPGNGRRAAAHTTEVEVRQELAPNERPTGSEVSMQLAVSPEGRSDVKLPV